MKLAEAVKRLPSKGDEQPHEKEGHASKEIRRVNAKLPVSIYTILEDLAAEKGKSMTDVLRDAVTLEKYLTDAIREGAHILIERNGTCRELVLR